LEFGEGETGDLHLAIPRRALEGAAAHRRALLQREVGDPRRLEAAEVVQQPRRQADIPRQPRQLAGQPRGPAQAVDGQQLQRRFHTHVLALQRSGQRDYAEKSAGGSLIRINIEGGTTVEYCGINTVTQRTGVRPFRRSHRPSRHQGGFHPCQPASTTAPLRPPPPTPNCTRPPSVFPSSPTRRWTVSPPRWRAPRRACARPPAPPRRRWPS